MDHSDGRYGQVLGGMARCAPAALVVVGGGQGGVDGGRGVGQRGHPGQVGTQSTDSGTYFGERMAGCLRSKNSGSPTLSLFISSMFACKCGGTSLRSPSRASASEVKYMTMV